MLIGLFADVHDHLDNIRRAVELFNHAGCGQVLFAGDMVSTISLPPLRKLNCPFFGCFGDNEGNKPGLHAGISRVGRLAEPPCVFEAVDGTKIALAHMQRQLRGFDADYDLAVVGHTHKFRIARDDAGRMVINPGETSGWSFGVPTVALFDLPTRTVERVELLAPLSPEARQ